MHRDRDCGISTSFTYVFVKKKKKTTTKIQLATIKGDLNIVHNDKLRDRLSKGPKYRETMPFTWKQNSKLSLIVLKSMHDAGPNRRT